MAKRTYMAAAFVGLLIGGAVWFWPPGPMWVSERGAGRICGFSLDRRILVTCSELVHGEQHVSRWDADSGRLLSRAVMACDEPKDRNDFRTIRPSPDGSIALVAQGVPFANDSLLELATGHWFLHDAVTGRRKSGPIEGVNYVDVLEPFSADGRWFAAYRGDPSSGVRASHALGIYSAETGACVADVSAESNSSASCRFAPGGESAAVCLAPKAGKGGEHLLVVQLFELPSGRRLRKADIRYPSRLLVQNWDGRHLAALDTSKESRQRIVYDFADVPLGSGQTDAVIRDYVEGSGKDVRFHWQNGRDWAAFFIDTPLPSRRPGIIGWLDWVEERLGRKRTGRPAVVWTVDRADGTMRYELPRLVSGALVFSEDGKRLACGGRTEGTIEVWSMDPLPRWPYALAWGMVAAGLLLAFGKWRRYRMAPAAPKTAQT